MDSSSTDPACNMPSATFSGTDSALGLSLMGGLDDDAITSLYSSSALGFGESWALAALLAPWNESDLHIYASNAFNFGVQGTQNGLGAQVHPHYPSPFVPSPATSTETLSPFGLAHVLDNTIPSMSPVGYYGLAFPTPATMGQDSTLPFLVGSPSPADVLAHAAQKSAAYKPSGILSPGGTVSPRVSHSAVSSATASLVQASSTPALGRQESLFKPATAYAGKSWPSPPSFPDTPSALHSNAPLPASASLTVLPRQEPHPLSNRARAIAFPRSASLPPSLKIHEMSCHQGASSIEDTATVSGRLMHPSLAQPVPAVKVTFDHPSLHIRAPRTSTPASLQTNHHNANPASATSAKPSRTISPLVDITNTLNTSSTSDVAGDVSHPAPAGMRIRKTGLKRTHACDQCPQSYVRAEHLRRHVKSKHLGLKEHVCGTCDFRCSRSDNLRLHMRAMHDA